MRLIIANLFENKWPNRTIKLIALIVLLLSTAPHKFLATYAALFNSHVMWPTAVQINGWTAIAPHLLFRSYQSLRLGVVKLTSDYIGTGNWQTDWNNALLSYNGGAQTSYPSWVRQHANDYIPAPAY